MYHIFQEKLNELDKKLSTLPKIQNFRYPENGETVYATFMGNDFYESLVSTDEPNRQIGLWVFAKPKSRNFRDVRLEVSHYGKDWFLSENDRNTFILSEKIKKRIYDLNLASNQLETLIQLDL